MPKTTVEVLESRVAKARDHRKASENATIKEQRETRKRHKRAARKLLRVKRTIALREKKAGKGSSD